MIRQRRPLPPEACARMQKLGYARSKQIRMYGQEFELVSDPFVEGNGIGIEVVTGTDLQVRVLRLPVMVTQSVLEETFVEETFALAA